jgi:hypothetical protein
MNAMSMPLLVIAGLSGALLLGWSATEVTPRGQSQAACIPAAVQVIPPEYLFYHGLVSPHAALSDKPTVQASCPSSKVIRT